MEFVNLKRGQLSSGVAVHCWLSALRCKGTKLKNTQELVRFLVQVLLILQQIAPPSHPKSLCLPRADPSNWKSSSWYACRLSGPCLTPYGLQRRGATWHFQSTGAWPHSVLKVWEASLGSQELHRNSSQRIDLGPCVRLRAPTHSAKQACPPLSLEARLAVWARAVWVSCRGERWRAVWS